jgi:hypothetical protein
MRATTAYFVGAGTIVAAIAIGLGGGLVAGNIMNPVTPKQGPDTARWERRAQPELAAMQPSERVPYLAGSEAMVVTLGAPLNEAQNGTRQGATETVAPPQAASRETPPEAPSADAQRTEPARPAQQQVSTEPASAPENAYAKAGDADLKRAAAEQRRAERHKRWAERRRQEMRHEMREARDRTDWDDVARNVRDDSTSRGWTSGPRSGFPQIRLFGSEDD